MKERKKRILKVGIERFWTLTAKKGIQRQETWIINKN